MSFAPRPLSVPAYQRRKRFGSTFGAKKITLNSSSRNPSVNPAAVPPPSKFPTAVPPSVAPINAPHQANWENQANSRSTNPGNTYTPANYANVSINHQLNSTLNSTKVADFTTRQRQISSPLRTTTPQPNWLATPPRVPSTPKSSSPKSSRKSVNPTFAPPMPWWLRSIFFFKYSSGLAVVGLIMAVLTTYGGLVSAQRQWTKEFQQLETLRQTERQLVAANEVIKNQIAKQSVGNQELVKVDPSSRVYIPEPEPIVLATVKPPTPTPSQSPKVIPLGY